MVAKRTRNQMQVRHRLQKQTIAVQPCARAHTSENDTANTLRQLALGARTVINLHLLACERELDQSERKP